MVYSFNFNKTTVDETKQCNFENEPNIEMIRRMNKNAPREYNFRYPNDLLKPEKEKQRNVVDVNVKITSTLWLLDKNKTMYGIIKIKMVMRKKVLLEIY